jgi:hypothetical protein
MGHQKRGPCPNHLKSQVIPGDPWRSHGTWYLYPLSLPSLLATCDVGASWAICEIFLVVGLVELKKSFSGWSWERNVEAHIPDDHRPGRIGSWLHVSGDLYQIRLHCWPQQASIFSTKLLLLPLISFSVHALGAYALLTRRNTLAHLG